MPGYPGSTDTLLDRRPLVLDTNVVLDLLVFDDVATRGLQQRLAGTTAHWLVTAAMRDELQRVLGYRQIATRLLSLGLDSAAVMLRFDRLSHARAPAAPAAIRCSDRDDQIFIDLAIAYRAVLLSKDQVLLRLHKRLARVGAGALSPQAYWAASCAAPAGDY